MQNSFYQDKKVLVTGAGGFIASHLVESLAVQGAQVRAFVRYNSRNDPGLLNQLDPHVKDHVEILAGDLRDYQAIQDAVKGMEIVFHLGALIAIPYSYLHPVEVVETNIMGTLNVLQAARSEGVQRVVHTSTSEVYGSARYVPINESHPLQGQSPYSASKIGADKLAESYYCAYNLPVVTIRPFNTFGPRQSARAVIPTIISQAITGKKIILGNLETRRDFTYVSDTVKGFLKGGETPAIEGQVLNLGTGKDFSIRDVLDLVGDIKGQPLEFEQDAERFRPEKSEVLRLLSDNSQAGRILGWQPEVTFRDGLRLTYEWISNHPQFFRPKVYER